MIRQGKILRGFLYAGMLLLLGGILPVAHGRYVLTDQEWKVSAKDGTGTKVNGSLPVGEDGDGTYVQFNGGAGNYIQVEPLPAFDIAGEGVHIVFRAKWEAFSSWSRIFDCGNGSSQNNLFISNNNTTSTLVIGLNPSASSKQMNANISNALTLNTLQSWDIVIGPNNGNNTIDAKQLSPDVIDHGNPAKELNGNVLDNVVRKNCYIGKSNWGDAAFKGKIYYILVESASTHQVLFEFDAAKMK